MKALLLVAHPDDEVLFAGGLMLSHPEIEWHVYTATYKASDPRGRERSKALDAFAARGVSFGPSPMLGLNDDGPYVLTKRMREVWRNTLLHRLDGFQPDMVVTHNRLGEYGHPHHMTLHAIALEIFDCPIWRFYCTAPSGVGEQEKLPFNYEIDLGSGLAIPKRQIMMEAYPDQHEGLRNNQVDLIWWAFNTYGANETFTSDVGWPS